MNKEDNIQKPKCIIFNKWALAGLVLFLILIEIWSVYLYREENIGLFDLYGSQLTCYQKDEGSSWYETSMETKSDIALFLGKSFNLKDCESLKFAIENRQTKANYLKANGLILKIYDGDKKIYEREDSYFSTMLAAVIIWLIPLGIIEIFQVNKHKKSLNKDAH